MKCGDHNQKHYPNLAGHPSFRRLNNDVTKSVEKMIPAGVLARQVLTSLRQDDPASLAIARTIYKAKSKRRRVILDGRTLIKALIDEL